MRVDLENDFIPLYEQQKIAFKRVVAAYAFFILLISLLFASYLENKNHITNMIERFNANHTLMCQSLKVSKKNGWKLEIQDGKYIFEDKNNYAFVLRCQSR